MQIYRQPLIKRKMTNLPKDKEKKKMHGKSSRKMKLKRKREKR